MVLFNPFISLLHCLAINSGALSHRLFFSVFMAHKLMEWLVNPDVSYLVKEDSGIMVDGTFKEIPFH